ncbi:MAG: FG-GAP repeat protein, partial [Anaerolineae bacterium]
MASPPRTAALLAALLGLPAPGEMGNGQHHSHIDGRSPTTLAGTAPGVVIDLATEAQTEILGAPAKDQLANDLRLGDVNADGLLDVLAGAHWGSESGRNIVGRSYALFGRPAWPARIDLAGAGAADWSFMGAGREARMGSSVATADLDGDGRADLAMGSLLGDPFGQVNGGAVYIMFGGPGVGGHVDFLDSEADALLAGSSATEGTDQLGTDMAAGDFDADGHQDLAVAAALRHDFSGAVFV